MGKTAKKDNIKKSLKLLVIGLLLTPFSTHADTLAFSSSNGPSTQSDLKPSLIDRQLESIQEMESSFGPYDIRLKEALKGLGFQLKNSGDYYQARDAYGRALHVSRINEGLYNASQISIVERLIELDLGLANWGAVNNHYAYLENLYKKLYHVDDPRLEKGLRKVVAWHIDASNVNLDGNRVEHLRKALSLFKLRLEVAELTLSGEDPLFDSLRQNIARSEYFLYMASDLNREMLKQRSRSLRDRYLATTD